MSTDDPVHQFTFLSGFSIQPQSAGGFIIQQSPGSSFRDRQSFYKAFTTFDDLVEFLIEQKKLFENPLIPLKAGAQLREALGFPAEPGGVRIVSPNE